MKLKIISIKDVQPNPKPFKTQKGMDGWGWKCTVSIDGADPMPVSLTVYSKKFDIKAGAEFTAGVDCKEIKVEDKEYNGTTYKAVTLYAMPAEGFGGGFTGAPPRQAYTPKAQISFDEYRVFAEKCFFLAKNLCGTVEGSKPENIVATFDRILSNGSVLVKIVEEAKPELAQKSETFQKIVAELNVRDLPPVEKKHIMEQTMAAVGDEKKLQDILLNMVPF
jgi:hypothetical protein